MKELHENESAPFGAPEGGARRPATASQLIRIGRHLGLCFHEAEILLELLEERALDGAADPPQTGLGLGLHRALRRYSPELLSCLRAIPGLFLLTDGVTSNRLERALARLEGLFDAGARIRSVLRTIEAAAKDEAQLLDRATRALLEGVRSGRIAGQAHRGLNGTLLLGLLEPFRRAYEH